MSISYQYGSSGAQVKKIQDRLARMGYDGGSDSVFGSNTRNAVSQFQKDYGLESTGVYDWQTNEMMNRAMDGLAQKVAQPSAPLPEQNAAGGVPANSESIPQGGAKQSTQEKLDALSGGYVPSQGVLDAQTAYEQLASAKPGAYQSEYDDLIRELYDQITNRGKFEYDLNGDALYALYRDAYTKGGQRAMMDTMGQAALLTGGYGNSYAETAGQQAYGQYMEGLANKVPELEAQAYDRYLREGEDLYRRYGMASDAQQQEYDRYRDAVSDWQDARDAAYDRYRSDYRQEYNDYLNERDYWADQAQREQDEYWNRMDYEQKERSANRSGAYDMAMSMLAQGALPSPEILQAAGIPEADARALIAGMQAASQTSSGRASGARKTSSSSKASASAGSSEKKQADSAQRARALELYEAGGMNGVRAYLDGLRAQGIDVDELQSYILKHGKTWGGGSVGSDGIGSNRREVAAKQLA